MCVWFCNVHLANLNFVSQNSHPCSFLARFDHVKNVCEICWSKAMTVLIRWKSPLVRPYCISCTFDVGSIWANNFSSSHRTLPATLPDPGPDMPLASPSGHLLQGRWRLRWEASLGSGEKQMLVPSCCLQSCVMALTKALSSFLPDHLLSDFSSKKTAEPRTLPAPIISCLRSVPLIAPLFNIISSGSSLMTWCYLSFPSLTIFTFSNGFWESEWFWYFKNQLY